MNKRERTKTKNRRSACAPARVGQSSSVAHYTACGRSFVCFVFGLCTLAGSKTKHTKLLLQADEITCSYLLPRQGDGTSQMYKSTGGFNHPDGSPCTYTVHPRTKRAHKKARSVAYKRSLDIQGYSGLVSKVNPILNLV